MKETHQAFLFLCYMAEFSIYQVFSNEDISFKGNTAAVVFLKNELEENEMQSIAADFNQPATSFLWKKDNQFHIRWFAPDAEIGLCGHGAFAALAFLKDQNIGLDTVTFLYTEGQLTGHISENLISMELNAMPVIKKIDVPKAIHEGLSIPILEMFETANKHIIVTDNESSVRAMRPNFGKLRKSEIFGYAITAPGDKVDFVSRTLVPHVQQLEDHATGSSHAMLTPYWASKLHKNQLEALQLSARGGHFHCELKDQMVSLSGNYKQIASGQLS